MGLILHNIMETITGLSLFTLVIVCVAEPNVDSGRVSLETTESTEGASLETTKTREGKVLPVFQVVKFPNDVCAGASRNGTCYTAEECSTKGGTSDGSCASGFGVCCVFALSCGGSASENQTYLIQSSVTTLTSPCKYTICPCSTDICRIRFDFTTMVLAGAVAGTVTAAAAAVGAAGTLNGPLIGDCVDDQFSISGGLGRGSPTICGTNTGYHMIVDADRTGNTCHTALFNIGGTTSTSRSWNILVTHYACGDTDSSGWPGCLQYYTATANNIQNFGFPPTITTVTSGVTHLSNQHYDICIRRASGSCYICYSPTIIAAILAAIGTPVIAQISFGVSIGATAANPASLISNTCTQDWIEIPGADTAAIAAISAAALTNGGRVCGRVLASITAAESDDTIAGVGTVCARHLPFRVGVNFDNSERDSIVTADMTTLTEQNGSPGGIVGFKLTYFQVSC